MVANEIEEMKKYRINVGLRYPKPTKRKKSNYAMFNGHFFTKIQFDKLSFKMVRAICQRKYKRKDITPIGWAKA